MLVYICDICKESTANHLHITLRGQTVDACEKCLRRIERSDKFWAKYDPFDPSTLPTARSKKER